MTNVLHKSSKLQAKKKTTMKIERESGQNEGESEIGETNLKSARPLPNDVYEMRVYLVFVAVCGALNESRALFHHVLLHSTNNNSNGIGNIVSHIKNEP